MKVNVNVENELIQKEHSYTFKSKLYEVNPFKITRRSCGRGAAKNRYYYQAHFIGFGDMLDIHKKSLVGREGHENIMRKDNPRFNPKLLNWIGDEAQLYFIT
ncbi:MAG: hypothetical protein JKY26_01560 [Pseudomonas sp.]|nr:hypothetical protein [Pseudomonas sp.]